MRKKLFETLINEYGLSPGAPTSVGNQSSATSSVASVAPSNSPTLNPGAAKQSTRAKGVDLVKGNQFKDPKTGQVRVVQSPIGDGDKPEAVVVQDPRTKKYDIIDQDEEVELTEEEFDIKDQHAKIKRRLGRRQKRLKKLLRAQKFNQQGEIIYELNFNNKDLEQVLDMPISCGFEAETYWPAAGISEIDIDEINWYDYDIYNQIPGYIESKIKEEWREWGLESGSFDNIYTKWLSKWVADNKEEEEMLDMYADEHLDDKEVQKYKTTTIEKLRKEVERGDEDEYLLDAEEERDDESWAREFIEINTQDAYELWLMNEVATDEVDLYNNAWEEWEEGNDINEWATEVYGGTYNMLANFNVDIDITGDETQDKIAEIVSKWAKRNSKASEVRYSLEYHGEGDDTEQDYWRVEPDGSLEGFNMPSSEIISPVFATPREMLAEMGSLFKFFELNNVVTNKQTGLHVTMSWNGEVPPDYDKSAGVLKMAMLLGDKYVAKNFNRVNNTYAVSQVKRIQQYLSTHEPSEINDKSFAALEKFATKGVSDAKFSSINPKTASNSDGNQLVEFRIAGGDNYHTQFGAVSDAVKRYATVMHAGYDNTAYRQDYVKALTKLVSASVGNPDATGENPAIDVISPFGEFVKSVSTPTNYFDNMEIAKNMSESDDPNEKKHLCELVLISILRSLSQKYGGDFSNVPPMSTRNRRNMLIGMKEAGAKREDILQALSDMVHSPSNQTDVTSKWLNDVRAAAEWLFNNKVQPKKAPTESVMKDLSKMSLQEQLDYVSKLDKRHVDKKWKEAQKRSQVMHFEESAVPDISKIRKLRQIMAEPLTGDDLRGQMEAYIAIPDPAMIREFRMQRAAAGDDCDLRGIVQAYIQRLHPKDQDQLSESKITETSLRPSELKKRNNFQVFVDKVRSGKPFPLVPSGDQEVIIDPKVANTLKTIDDFAQYKTGSAYTLPLKTPGKAVNLGHLLKTQEFGGTAAKTEGVANRGELAEGVLGAATFARIIKRPGTPITYDEVLKIIKSLPKTDTGGTIERKAKGKGKGAVTDIVRLTVRLGPNTYKDLIDVERLTADKLMNSYIKSTVQFVNDYTKLYANYFEFNGRPDEIEIVSDGVSENTDKKTDVFMVYQDEDGNRILKHFDISLKAGTVKQFGQVGTGRSTTDLEQRFDNMMKLFTQFGLNPSDFKYSAKTFAKKDEETNVKFLRHIYKQAAKQFKALLAGDDNETEYSFLTTLSDAVTYFGTSNDPNVKLLQLDKGRYYLLDFRKMRRKLDEVDLDIIYREAGPDKLPMIHFIDRNLYKEKAGVGAQWKLLTLRLKSDHGYVRQILEKEPLLKQLISVRAVGDIET